jgi:hypothetical protein
MTDGENGFPDTSEEVSGQNRGGRPRKWENEAERKAAAREEKRAAEEQARKDEEYVQRELEITRAQFPTLGVDLRVGSLKERLERSEAYLRKWVSGEIGPRSRS